MKINAMACHHRMVSKARHTYNWLSSIQMFRDSGVLMEPPVPVDVPE